MKPNFLKRLWCFLGLHQWGTIFKVGSKTEWPAGFYYKDCKVCRKRKTWPLEKIYNRLWCLLFGHTQGRTFYDYPPEKGGILRMGIYYHCQRCKRKLIWDGITKIFDKD